MTWLEIAELTGKQHKNVMQAIRNMEPAWVKTCGSNFRLTSRTIVQPNGGTRITRCQARCDIMEAIRKMEPAWVKVNGRNFALVEYKDAKGELRPITRCQARCD